MSYRADFAETLRHQSEWRRQKAEQHPDDRRNLRAAEILDKLGAQAEAGEFDAELFGRYSDAAYGDDDTSTTISVEAGELLREIGFQSFPETVDEFLDDLMTRARRVS